MTYLHPLEMKINLCTKYKNLGTFRKVHSEQKNHLSSDPLFIGATTNSNKKKYMGEKSSGESHCFNC